MYQVLYRKWRPQVFEDVVGQPQVTKTLKNAIKAGRINHAYLFTGSRGTGKTTCAKILAKAVNCLDPHDGDPCGECESCRGIDDGSILDVVEMDAASNRGIDDIRDIIDEAQFRPARAKYRVYIIDEVHMLTDQAFNALLKILEEPPEHVIFILATTEVHKLLPTILSRCQRFDFHRIVPEAIVSRLNYVVEQEGATIYEDAARLIAALSDGAMRDALSLTDRCLGNSNTITVDIVREAAGLVRKDYLFELASACINKNPAKALEIVSRLHNESKDMARLCDELLDHFRSLMMIKATNHPRDMIVMSDEEFEDAELQSNYLTLGEVVYIMDVLQNAYNRMGKGNSNKTELEMALVKLSAPELDGTNEALIARISALEKAFKSGIAIKASEPGELTVVDVIAAEEEPEDEIEEVKEDEPVEADEELPSPPDVEDISEPVSEPAKESKPAKRTSVDVEEIYHNAKPFRQWPEVVENIKKYSRAIGSAFSGTNAYESGGYLLIDANNEIAFNLLKQSTQRANIRTAIQEITGRTYKLGPYKKPEKTEVKNDPLAELITDLKVKGIEVNEE
ncbi:MAG: DNA polymerase III subunit gamma/tau [Ruminococcus sp.]|nr:DNA polymerase III subunit gamma/tau [Ruminococcus sp.]